MMRSSEHVVCAKSPQVCLSSAQGVRSISFLDHMLTVGSGDGFISVWDRRAGQYLQTLADAGDVAGLPSRAESSALADCDADHWVSKPREEPLALELAGGYLEENEVYECVMASSASWLLGVQRIMKRVW